MDVRGDIFATFQPEGRETPQALSPYLEILGRTEANLYKIMKL